MKKNKLKFVFLAPRFHTNQICWVEALLEHDHEVEFNVLFKAFSENYSLVEPTVFSPCKASTIIMNLFGKGGSGLNLYRGFPNPIYYFKSLKKSGADVIVIRDIDRWFSFLGAICARTLRIKIIIYTQIPLHRKYSLKGKLVMNAISRIFNAKFITPVLGEKSEEYVYGQVNKLNSIKDLFKNQPHTLLAVKNIIAEHHSLQKEIDNLKNQQALEISNTLLNNAKVISDIRFISEKTKLDINQAKNLAQKLRLSGENIVAVLSTHNNEKVNLIVSISDKLILTKGYNAGNIIKEISPYIKGGGGGQPFLATAGGKDASGIDAAFQAAKEIVTK